MATTPDRQIEHLLRRAGFGARPDELDTYGAMSIPQPVDALVNYERVSTDVDALSGHAGYANVTTLGLFTVGVGNYTEPDVYAAARVFTGWNLQQIGNAADGSRHFEFVYLANQHETTAKTFSFPIYPDGNRTIPGRAAADGMQDGIDFI